MILYIVTERKYHINNEDRKFDPIDTIEDYNFYQRYLDVFDEVRVVARCPGEREVQVLPSKHQRLSCVCIPNSILYILFNFYIFRGFADGVLLVRYPGLLSWLVLLFNIDRLKTINMEIVSNPVEELEADFPLFARFSWILCIIVRFFIQKTNLKSFVTEKDIQTSIGVDCGTDNYSSLELDENFTQIGASRIQKKEFVVGERLIFIGQLDKNFKRLDRALKVLALLPNAELTVVGSGKV